MVDILQFGIATRTAASAFLSPVSLAAPSKRTVAQICAKPRKLKEGKWNEVRTNLLTRMIKIDVQL